MSAAAQTLTAAPTMGPGSGSVVPIVSGVAGGSAQVVVQPEEGTLPDGRRVVNMPVEQYQAMQRQIQTQPQQMTAADLGGQIKGLAQAREIQEASKPSLAPKRFKALMGASCLFWIGLVAAKFGAAIVLAASGIALTGMALTALVVGGWVILALALLILIVVIAMNAQDRNAANPQPASPNANHFYEVCKEAFIGTLGLPISPLLAIVGIAALGMKKCYELE